MTEHTIKSEKVILALFVLLRSRLLHLNRLESAAVDKAVDPGLKCEIVNIVGRKEWAQATEDTDVALDLLHTVVQEFFHKIERVCVAMLERLYSRLVVLYHAFCCLFHFARLRHLLLLVLQLLFGFFSLLCD